MAKQLLVPRHVGTETGVTIKNDLQTDLTTCEASINQLDIEHNSNGTHKTINTPKAIAGEVVTPKLTFPDGSLSSSQNIGGTAQTLSAAMALGKEADLGADDFALTQGGRDLLRVDKQRGLAGMVGNINSPLTHLDFSGLELQPFASAACTNVTAVAAVPAPVFGLSEMTLTFAAVPAGVVEQKCFATINSVDYPIRLVTATTVIIEYDDTLTDPTGTPAVIFSLWRFRGKYAGNHNYARASRKTYTDPLTGNLRMMPAGYPCFERMADGKVGISLEGVGGNLFPTSSTTYNLNNPTYFTVVANNATAPDGTLTASTHTNNDVSQRRGIMYVSGLLAATTYTYSLAVRAVTGSPTILFGADGADGGTTAYTITQDWQRVSFTFTTVLAQDNFMQLFIPSLASVETSDAQVEALPFASSYIPTAGAAVNRVADNLSIDAMGNALNAGASGAVLTSYDVLGDSNVRPVSIENGGTADAFRFDYDPAAGFNYNGTVWLSPTVGVHQKAAVLFDGVTKSLFIDSALSAQATAGTYVGIFPASATSISIGRFAAAGANVYHYGRVASVSIYDSVLTDQEVGAA